MPASQRSSFAASRRRRRRLGIGLAAVVLAVTACGDDDGVSSPAALDAAAFCERLGQLEQLGETAGADGEGDFTPEVLAALSDLAAAAPEPELRDALVRFGEAAEQLAELDQDDPAAFGVALALMGDEDFARSMELLEDYAVDECGFDPEASSPLDPAEEDLAIDEHAYERMSDDLDILQAALEEEIGPIQGLGTWRGMGAPTLSVDLDTSAVDPVEVCEAVGAVFDDLLSAEGLPVEVNDLEQGQVAARPAGGSCAAP